MTRDSDMTARVFKQAFSANGSKQVVLKGSAECVQCPLLSLLCWEQDYPTTLTVLYIYLFIFLPLVAFPLQGQPVSAADGPGTSPTFDEKPAPHTEDMSRRHQNCHGDKNGQHVCPCGVFP